MVVRFAGAFTVSVPCTSQVNVIDDGSSTANVYRSDLNFAGASLSYQYATGAVQVNLSTNKVTGAADHFAACMRRQRVSRK